jgi:hypothetical protein
MPLHKNSIIIYKVKRVHLNYKMIKVNKRNNLISWEENHHSNKVHLEVLINKY